MADASTFEAIERLKNGAMVTIRAVRPGDKAAVADAFGKLAPESIYTRFFQAKGALTEGELKAATEVDFERVVALVVTTEVGGKEAIIGGGRYAVLDGCRERSAEIAFVVEEDYRGLGIAGRVLRQLARIAREKGVREFQAEVLGQNRTMLAVMAHSGLTMKTSEDEGIVHVTLRLA